MSDLQELKGAKQNDGPLSGFDEGTALRTILEGTATAMGERFFTALVENLAAALHTHGAWVTEIWKKAGGCARLRFG